MAKNNNEHYPDIAQLIMNCASPSIPVPFPLLLHNLSHPPPQSLTNYISRHSVSHLNVFRKNNILFGLLEIVSYLRGAKSTYARYCARVKNAIFAVFTSSNDLILNALIRY